MLNTLPTCGCVETMELSEAGTPAVNGHRIMLRHEL